MIHLESRGEGNLHWAAITGILDSSSDPLIRIANSADRSFSELHVDLGLGKVGSSVVRSVLHTLFGLEPNTIVRLERIETAVPITLSNGDAGFACP